MRDHLLNTRRFFRNRFHDYGRARVPYHDPAELDGSPLTLSELCSILAEDDEPFPTWCAMRLSQLFNREHLATLGEPITYGDVARLIERRLKFRAA